MNKGTDELCKKYEIPFLGKLPLDRVSIETVTMSLINGSFECGATQMIHALRFLNGQCYSCLCSTVKVPKYSRGIT